MSCLSGLLICATALAATGAEQSPDEAPLPALELSGYWRFDVEALPNADTGVRDHSPHGLHGTLQGSAKTGSSGRFGSALLLDGEGGYVQCPDAPDLNPDKQLTAMAWFRLEKGTLETQKVLVSKGASSHAEPYYQYAIAAMDGAGAPATLTFYAAVNGTLQACSARDLPLDLYTGWHHVAGTYDGQTMRLYLNGREVSVANASGVISTYRTPLVMGAYANLPKTPTYSLAGALDDVAVYVRALSADEIESYYWRARVDLVLSSPGTGEAFGSVADDHVAAQPFRALGPALESAAIWLSEGNDDELLVQIRKNELEGAVLASASLSAGPAGKRVITFDPPVAMQTRPIYILKVSAGAPGTTRGAVQKRASGNSFGGLTETGPSDSAMAVELRFLPSGLRQIASVPHNQPRTEADICYEAAVNAALSAKRDVWGEELMRRPEGPTYENVVDYLRPMLWVGDYVTTSGVYYLALGRHDNVTGGEDSALHVADGSEIISRHHKTGRRTRFLVGIDGSERYGSDLRFLDGPQLYRGYQPVLMSEYVDGDGNRWGQESFATQIDETESLVSFVRITRLAGQDGKSAELRVRTALSDAVMEGNRLVSGGLPVLVLQPGAVFEPPYLRYTFPADESQTTVLLLRLNQPATCRSLVLDAERFEAERDAVCRHWDEHLKRGAVVEVPEKRVMDAARNLLIQNLFMTWRYSIGNAYESWYPQESGDALQSLGEFGFLDEYMENLQELLPRTFRGEDERVVEYANKLYYTVHCARLTADDAWLESNRPLVKSWIEGMRNIMTNDTRGLLGKTRAGDIHTHCYYSNHQALGWRGLRDMGTLCAERGWHPEANAASEAAESLRKAFVTAFNATKVEMPDGTLFFPKVLTDSPATPYDPITATRLGSYWNLSIGTALKSGVFDPRGETMRRTVDYMRLHGARLLGLTRFNYYPVPVGSYRDGGLPGYSTSGADNVYGPGILHALAELDEADEIVLSLYGKLAHGMTRGTFISGEGDSYGVVPGKYYRALYLPPSNTNNALFLKTLHDMLVFTHVGNDGKPEELLLSHFTPRAWLEHGRTIRVERAPTMFGQVSFTLRSKLDEGIVEAEVLPPSRAQPKRLALRMRVPVGHELQSVEVNGRQQLQIDRAQATIDLSGLSGTVRVTTRFRSK